ncbi:MAG: hypothetical protein NT028_02665 [candidate division Zixibacteria bacterium]|nr:hypothetical protein [candidate division Zixibacteria bacterium]
MRESWQKSADNIPHGVYIAVHVGYTLCRFATVFCGLLWRSGRFHCRWRWTEYLAGALCHWIAAALGAWPNKFQSTFGSLTSSYNYVKHGGISLREAIWGIAFTITGRSPVQPLS